MARTLINVPATVKRGQVFEVRTLIAHPMETGYRHDGDGQAVPRDLLRRFECRYNGVPVFGAELFTAVAANPYIAFHLRAADSGTLTLSWTGDNGFAQTETVALNVTD